MAQDNKEVDFLNMSDEDMANASLPSDTDVVEVATEEVVEDVSTNQEGDVKDDESATDGVQSTDEGQAATEESSEGLLDAVKEDVLDSKEEVGSSKETKAESSDGIDYKAEYNRLLTPFKANGRDIEVKGIDDAIALMQMGANYNKKMAALKPNLKLMKLLENNGLLSEERIGFLIDLEKKNPEAISKLVKESGLDPLDLDTNKAGDYKPAKYTVDDREIDLDTVLDELQGTPTYNQTLNIVSNVWDGASKQVIANSPQLLKVINSHVQSGIYELISKEIESERMFGRLDGLSDIEAYRQVGDSLQAKGKFNHLSEQVKTTPQKPVVIQPNPKKEDDDKLREKKRAASSTKSAGSNQVKEDYNPLSLSDDAFGKLVNDKYL